VIWIGEGERILPTAIIEKFVTRADGELEPLTEGSTRAITSTVTHAGIVKSEAVRLQHALTPATWRPNAKTRPIPESVVEIDRDGAKSGACQRRRVDASKVRLRFGLLSGESSFIDRAHRDTCGMC
jgi:hypothetical protein